MAQILKAIPQLFSNVIKDYKLLLSLSFKDFKRRFAGSYFGILWGFVQPLLTILVYWVVFQFGFRSGDVDGIPFLLWFMCGIVPWLFISEAITTASSSLIEYSYLVKKVVFNIDILPLVKIASSGYIHLCFMGLILAIGLLLGFFPSILVFQVVYYLFCTIALLTGICLFTSAIMVFFRDLNQIISIVILLGMWGTPIAWNPANFSEEAQRLFKINPIYYIVEGYRDSFLSRAWFWEKPYEMLWFWTVTILVLLLGTVVFNRLKPHFADVL